MPNYTNDIYDVEESFRAIEDELIQSMMRNMEKYHIDWEEEEGFRWSQWQAEQLKALEKYKHNNKTAFTKRFSNINSKIDTIISAARQQGGMDQEIAILKAIKNGHFAKKVGKSLNTNGEFFKLNDRKLNALITAIHDDFSKAEFAMLRQAEDQYRQIIFNAEMYANTGAGTYAKAVDMATKDFLTRGITCIEYKNGARHTIADYSMMCLRTASKRAYLTGEGEKRQEWGEHLVIMNKRGNPCPMCLPFVGKVLIDDVWSGGSSADGDYHLMSDAMKAGLYHPNCKDSHTTYFAEISDIMEKYSSQEMQQLVADYQQEQKKKYMQNQTDKYRRLAENSLDPNNRKLYKRKENLLKSKINSIESKGSMNKYCTDITKEWKNASKPNSREVVDLQEFSIGNEIYRVDGKHVLLDYKQHERKIAEMIEEKLGGEIFMIPRVSFPQGIHTPDYVINGERFDLKSPIGKGKNVLYNMVSKKKEQSNNFVFDISNCPLDYDKIKNQIIGLYTSSHTKFINMLIVIKENQVLNVFRKK